MPDHSRQVFYSARYITKKKGGGRVAQQRLYARSERMMYEIVCLRNKIVKIIRLDWVPECYQTEIFETALPHLHTAW